MNIFIGTGQAILDGSSFYEAILILVNEGSHHCLQSIGQKLSDNFHTII
jgi:hypothetical protein